MIHRRPLLALLALTCFGCWSPAAFATDFAALVEQAKADFEPLTADDVEAARSELAKTAAAVERRLGPETPFGAAWLEHLRWSGVQKQLAEGASFDPSAARATLARLATGAEGLESPVLQRAADALERFLGVASFARVRDQRAIFDRQADLLGRVLSERSVDDVQMSYEVERRLELFHNAGLAAELVDAVRSENGRANVYFEASSPLLGRLVNRAVSECGPVSDTILGTRIRGTGVTTGDLTVHTLPATHGARLEFLLTGTTRSRTRGVNGPVAIYSTGATNFTARKVVELNDRRFRLMPSSAGATTRTTTQSVKRIGGGLLSGLIERIASDRVAENKSRADAIAADHAEDRIRADLDRQLTEKLRDARREYDDRFTKPLRRRRALPDRIDASSTGDALFVEALQARPWQLGAASDPPAAVDGELSARFHQSAANNLLAAYLGGATLRRDSQDEAARLDGRVTPAWLKRRDDEPTRAPREDVDFEPYQLTFREGRPVSMAFADGVLRATIHTARIRVNADDYADWDFILTFRPKVADGRWKLVREGEVEVLPTGFKPDSGKRLTSRQLALRSNLADALNDPADRLPQEIRLDPIDLDPDAPIDLLAMQHLRFEDGWAIVAWAAE